MKAVPMRYWEWLTGTTAKGKRIGIEPPCGGSERCAGAIHIEKNDGNRVSSFEIHLTREEIKWVRRMLKRALATPSTD